MFFALYLSWCGERHTSDDNDNGKCSLKSCLSQALHFHVSPMIELRHYHTIIFPTFHFSDDDFVLLFKQQTEWERWENRLIKLCKIIELMLLHWTTFANNRTTLILKIYSCIIELEEKRPIFMFDSSIRLFINT